MTNEPHEFNYANTDAIVRDIKAERLKQFMVKGWTLEHDDQHSFHDWMRIASRYTQQAYRESMRGDESDYDTWRVNVIKACAVLVASVEALDRRAAHTLDL